MKSAAIAAMFAALAWAGPALSGAPEPRKPFDSARMPGRWYEIARTPTLLNKDCQGGSTDWTAAGPGRFKVTAICRKGAPGGPARTMSGVVKVIDRAANNRLRMSILGGLIGGEYWLIDRADDYGWLIMGTPGGGYVALMSSRPQLSGPARAEAVARLKALGYDTAKLVFPAH